MIEISARKRLREFGLEVELTFASGVTVLAGPSGSGKSTLLRVIAGLTRPDSGRVVLGGRVLDDGRLHVPAFRRDVAYLFQEYALFPHLDVLDNVAYGLAARGVARGTRDATARAWLARFGIDALAGARPALLSGGERQRVALARALACAPRALLLDEPFAALDAATATHVRDELRATLAPLDIPVVVVTHDESDARALGAPSSASNAGASGHPDPWRKRTAPSTCTVRTAPWAPEGMLRCVAEGRSDSHGRLIQAYLPASTRLVSRRSDDRRQSLPLHRLTRVNSPRIVQVQGRVRSRSWEVPHGWRVHVYDGPTSVCHLYGTI